MPGSSRSADSSTSKFKLLNSEFRISHLAFVGAVGRRLYRPHFLFLYTNSTVLVLVIAAALAMLQAHAHTAPATVARRFQGGDRGAESRALHDLVQRPV